MQDSAFKDCTALESVNILNNSVLVSLYDMAFSGCTSLKTINLENFTALKTLRADAFANCSSLQAITIPSSVTTVNSGVFTGCTSLKTVTVDSASVAKLLTSNTGVSNLIANVETLFIKNSLTVPSYISSTYQSITSTTYPGFKTGYKMFIKI